MSSRRIADIVVIPVSLDVAFELPPTDDDPLDDVPGYPANAGAVSTNYNSIRPVAATKELRLFLDFDTNGGFGLQRYRVVMEYWDQRRWKETRDFTVSGEMETRGGERQHTLTLKDNFPDCKRVRITVEMLPDTPWPPQRLPYMRASFRMVKGKPKPLRKE